MCVCFHVLTNKGVEGGFVHVKGWNWWEVRFHSSLFNLWSNPSLHLISTPKSCSRETILDSVNVVSSQTITK